MGYARNRFFEPKMTAKDDFLKNVNDTFDAVYDAIDLPSMSIMQIIDRIKQFKFRVDSRIVQSIIQNKLDYIFNDPVCEECKSNLHYKYSKNIKIDTTIGKLNFQFPYFSCPECKSCHSPHQNTLNTRSGTYQYDAQKIAAKMSSGGTFKEASELLNDIYGFNISPDTVHRLTNDLAAEVELVEIIPTPDEIGEIVARISKGKRRRPVFVFAADGAMAPIRTEPPNTPNCWREAKGVRGYLLDGDKIVHLLSWHQVSSKADFVAYLSEIKAKGIIPTDKIRLCFIGDGADWIWETVNAIFPDCRQVLDYFHCSQHLFDFAKERFGNNSAKGREWVEQTKVRLFHNNILDAISGLKRFKCDTPASQKSRDGLIRYLSSHKNRVDYGKLRRGGYPLGSGAIESANKFISSVRLKSCGAWWKVDYANNILKLRCAKYNGKFDQRFEDYEQSKRNQAGVKRNRLRRIK